ncbi:DUF2235 domain-containing protein [Streptomyces sp. NBC_01136]|uniref:phospholipase effector Tle1 domain-containing protein n=1 Tax=unclassified Streptomyces TaxID=2593676 RepID=UPI0032442151|nr:DUF2235 domain-containing protein [Streptomyces sp. NBC_01136]
MASATSTTQLTGSRSAAADAAAVPAAIPGTTPSPGSGASRTPTAPPAGVLRLGNLNWPYTHQLPNAARVRHAVSLDETRRPYREFLVTPRPEPLQDTAEEVWFAGVHSDVGGTFAHAENAPLLSTIPLKWITDGVTHDLDFRPGASLEDCAVTEEFASAPVHDNGPLWILAGRRSRPVPEGASLHAGVRLRRERDPRYRSDLPDPREPGRWADPDWTKPAQSSGG